MKSAFRCTGCLAVYKRLQDAVNCCGAISTPQGGLFHTPTVEPVFVCDVCGRAHHERREAWHCCKMPNEVQARKNIILKRLIMRLGGDPVGCPEHHTSAAQALRTGRLRRQLFRLHRQGERRQGEKGLFQLMTGRAK